MGEDPRFVIAARRRLGLTDRRRGSVGVPRAVERRTSWRRLRVIGACPSPHRRDQIRLRPSAGGATDRGGLSDALWEWLDSALEDRGWVGGRGPLPDLSGRNRQHRSAQGGRSRIRGRSNAGDCVGVGCRRRRARRSWRTGRRVGGPICVRRQAVSPLAAPVLAATAEPKARGAGPRSGPGRSRLGQWS